MYILKVYKEILQPTETPSQTVIIHFPYGKGSVEKLGPVSLCSIIKDASSQGAEKTMESLVPDLKICTLASGNTSSKHYKPAYRLIMLHLFEECNNVTPF